MKTKNILLTGLLALVITVFGNIGSVTAMDDFDKELILKGDHGGNNPGGGLGPRSVTLKLEEVIVAYQNENNIAIEFIESVGNTTISIVNANDLTTVYERSINTRLEYTHIINTNNLQAGTYNLVFVDQRGRQASTSFQIE